MRYLVTGCTGFLGSRLINHLIERDHEVFCLSRSEDCPHGMRGHHVQQDLSLPLNGHSLPDHLDYLIHCAASMEKGIGNIDLFRSNTVSTLNLLEFGKTVGIKKFAFMSSGAVYGYDQTAFSEESSIKPTDFYGQTKVQGEFLVNYYHRRFFSAVILRLFFPYGPGQLNGIIPRLIESIRNKRSITIYNDEAPRVNPIYIDDAVKAIEKSLSLEKPDTLNLCGDQIASIKELSLLIGRQLKQSPVFIVKEDKEISNLIGNNRLMKETLGVSPLVSLEEGISRMLRDA